VCSAYAFFARLCAFSSLAFLVVEGEKYIFSLPGKGFNGAPFEDAWNPFWYQLIDRRSVFFFFTPPSFPPFFFANNSDPLYLPLTALPTVAPVFLVFITRPELREAPRVLENPNLQILARLPVISFSGLFTNASRP